MRRKFSFFCYQVLTIILFFNLSFAQSLSEDLWDDIQEEEIQTAGERYIIPKEYRTLKLDFQELKDELANAPSEENVKVSNSTAMIDLPLPNGEFARFKFVESFVMEEGLADRYPGIRTYLGQGIDDATASARFDFTPSGFHAIIFSVDGTVYIDPYSMGDTQYYISYYKSEFPPSLDQLSATCNVQGLESSIALEIREMVMNGPDVFSGDELRTYRLACATTGEYTIFHGGTVPLGLAAVVTAVNRVTGVYELEVAVRMVLIANNDQLIYTNPATDPYTNNSGFQMLAENQTNIDAVIGSANYDIGHVFSTGGGGIAFLGVVCVNGFKARGVTGLPNPIGDPFYIDYVAHEMGHQYAGNHSFNGSAGACSGGNRNAATAYEPGSGSTIMAYAGICGSQNLQSNSDAYFHNINFVEIINYTTNGSGNSCPVITTTGNNPPVVDAGTGGFTIPISTPFILTGSATDPDGDTLTYNWEQFDLGPAGHPNFPSGNAPIFRSFNASLDNWRTFPKLSDLLNNTQTIGEILPTYSRTLTFRLTARDNKAGGGGVDYDQVQFSVSDAAGPFLVTSPNTAVTWLGLTVQTIEWDVANTDLAPVNTSDVNILLSTDGGITYPVVLASNTPNDGTEQILLPNLPTTEARIKVEASNNIFFDISNQNFTIEDNPIPVELTAFFAIITEEGVLLKWTTATETNNAGFNIERSNDNIDYEEIAFVQGKGTTVEVTDYSFTDKNVETGIYYYRLKQLDFDGSFNYINEVQVDINAPTTFSLSQNYPNPFNPATGINYQIPDAGFVSLKVYDVIGNEVALLVNERQEEGKYQIQFDAAALPSGVYFYTLRAGSFVETKKMMLMK